MLNWTVWNRTVLTFHEVWTKNCTCTKLNCLKLLSKWLSSALSDSKKVDTPLKQTNEHEVEYNWFEFRVFLLLDWLPYQDESSQPSLVPLLGRGLLDSYFSPRDLVPCEMQTASPKISI